MNKTRLTADITSALTILAALPYELGEAATMIPPEWKQRVVVTGLIATVLLRIIGRIKGEPVKK